MKRASGIALLLAVAACTVGPDYHPPATPAPEHWSGTAAGPEFSTSGEALAAWWAQFHDPQLDWLVGQALTQNLDIQSADERIVQARAQREAAAGAWFPTLSGSAQGTRYRVPDSLRELPQDAANAAAGEAGAGGAPPVPIHLPSYLSIYQAGFDSSWELDLFGRTRRAVEAADASTQAAVAARRGAVVSTLGELGNQYVQLRGIQARLLLARRTVDVETQLLELARNRAATGMVSQLDVDRAQAQLDASRAQLPLLEAQRLESIHAMAVLVGRQPEDLEPALSAEAPQLPVPPRIPVQLPAAVLRRRPDVQQAERQLAAATAQVGVAVANRFPSLSLTGSTGLASNQLDQLLRHSNWTWNAGVSLTAPIFQGGELEANQRGAESAARESELQYRKTVLQALAETEDALQGYAAQSRSRDAQAEAAEASRRALRRATDLYQAGIGSFLDVLDADRSLAQTQDQLAQGDTMRLQELISLYKALGGGWEAAEAPPAQADSSAAAE